MNIGFVDEGDGGNEDGRNFGDNDGDIVTVSGN